MGFGDKRVKETKLNEKFPNLVNVCLDRNRCVKLLRFDKFGQSLFGLCEPVEPQDPQSTNLLKPFYRRELQLIRLNLYGICQVDVCRKFVVNPPQQQSDNREYQGYCTKRTKLRDLAYGSTEKGNIFGIVYSSEPSAGAVDFGLRNIISTGLNNYGVNNANNCRLKRHLVTIDLENDCETKMYEIEHQCKSKCCKRSRLKLFHLTNGVGWVLVEIDFDTEQSLMGSSCEFLTFHSVQLNEKTGKATLKELMTYSAEQYYVHLTAVESKIYIFRSTDVNVYDAAQDAFCSSVHLPVYSNYIFKIEERLYLLPQFWQEPTRLLKESPKCLLTFDGKRWQDTDLIIDENLLQNGDQSSAVKCHFTKELFVAGSNAGFLVVSCSNRSKVAGSKDKNELINEYNVYRLNRPKNAVKSLKLLAYEKACSFYTHEQILIHRLPPNVFREFYGPQWQREEDSCKTVQICLK